MPKSSLMLVTCLLLGAFSSVFANVSGAERAPTILVVVLDDMRETDWQAFPRTEALLGDRFRVYPNAFVTTPLCCPSRTSILTGQYTHNHGIKFTNRSNNGGWQGFAHRRLASKTIASALDRAGWRTVLVGKFLFGYPERKSPVGGWDERYASGQTRYVGFTLNENGRPVDYDRADDYLTDVEARIAVGAIDRTKPDVPLFLYFAPKAPHAPMLPAPRHRNALNNVRVEDVPSVGEDDLTDKPRHVREGGQLTPSERAALDVQERLRLRTLLAVDEAIVRIWQSLGRSGRADNTTLIILSDNGYLMGHHGWNGKAVPYEESIRIPIRALGPAFEGGEDSRIAATIDIAPTIAEIAEVALPRADGVSLLGDARRASVLVEYYGSNGNGGGGLVNGRRPVPSYQAIRTSDNLYVEYETGERELYDLVEDPFQLTNLLGDGTEPEHVREMVESLQARLRSLVICSGSGECTDAPPGATDGA
jgi:arylsulfatase A-like enzyme